MSTAFSVLRRTLAQRINYWGGGLSNNGVGSFSANGTSNTAIDTTRPEPDDEWNESWVIVYPGGVDQNGATATPVWRRLAATSGWVQNSGIMQIQGTWPAPIAGGPTSGTPYELYKVFRPESWLQAINWALANSYPFRHVKVIFEVPQDYFSRVINWGSLVRNLNVATPTGTLVLSEVADGKGTFQPGNYSFNYSYYNDMGETLVSTGVTAPITVVGTNSKVQVNALTGIPANVTGVNYYCSNEAGSTQLSQLSIGQAVMATSAVLPAVPGVNNNGIAPQVTFTNPAPPTGNYPPLYNTTSPDMVKLHRIQMRINPGVYPEIWNDLGSDLWKPLGGNSVELAYFPVPNYNIRFVGSAVVPLMASETDTSAEPSELIYAGAEYYLWGLLSKTSTIVNVNWEKLASASLAAYKGLLFEYAMDKPTDVIHRPVIRTRY